MRSVSFLAAALAAAVSLAAHASPVTYTLTLTGTPFSGTGGFTLASAPSAIGLSAENGTITAAVVPSSVTPEPSGIALLGTGLLGVAGVLKRRVA